MKILMLALVSLGSLALAEESYVEVTDDSHTYEYSFNGCSTGKHEFPDTASLCAGLQDNALNNNCADILRRAAFKGAKCPGVYTPR